MANLANPLDTNDIGLNYKGLLNIDTVVNTPLDATLRVVTDGMGTSSALSLSTLGARVDGSLFIYDSTRTANSRQIKIYQDDTYFYFSTRNDADDSGENFLKVTKAGSNLSELSLGDSNGQNFKSNINGISIGNGTLTQNGVLTVKGTGGNIFSGRNSADVQKFYIGDSGNVVASNTVEAPDMKTPNLWSATGIITMRNAAYTGSAFVVFGVNTNLFPALTANGNGLDVKLGDNSGYTDIRAHRNFIGTQTLSISSTANGTASSTAGRGFLFEGQSGQGISLANFVFSSGDTTGTVGAMNLSSTFYPTSGTATHNPLRITYTINTTGTYSGTTTGIFLNATETSLTGTTHNLMDLQVGGVSKFKVSNGGALETNSYIVIGGTSKYEFNSRSQIQSSANSNITLLNNAGTSFNLLQLGGTTNAFPALKRNGAAIDFRLADDSGACAISIGGSSTSIEAFTVKIGASYGALMYADGRFTTKGSGKFGDTNGYDLSVASAILQADSTTRGFLPPRMTTTQINAISSPADGLVVYNTTLSNLCVYEASAWRKLNSSPM